MSRFVVAPTVLLFLTAACGGGETYVPPAVDETPAEIQADQPAVVSADELPAAVAPPEARPSAPPPPQSRAAPPPARATPQPQPPPAGEPEPEYEAPPPAAEAALTLGSGTALELSTVAEITSRTTKAGDVVKASTARDIVDDRGRTVIPAGAVVSIRVLEIEPAENQGEQGRLTLRPESVMIDGESHLLRADVTALRTELQGRGVTAGDAGKVAAGAAAGAVLGRILGKKSTATVVGGVAGAAVGTAVAVKTADRDVVVPAGSAITVTLTEEFSRTGS